MPKKKPQPRRYQKKARADQEELTKQKIAEAVVELHRTVGPAKTTISDVANIAGVGRVTVYKHFPTDADLFKACGDHWLAQNPPPDFSPCFAIDNAHERIACILNLLYPYYRQTHDMMGNVLRDAQIMPALANIVDEGWLQMIRELEAGVAIKNRRALDTKKHRATVRLALDLTTWKTLTDSGLSDKQAAELVSGWLNDTK